MTSPSEIPAPRRAQPDHGAFGLLHPRVQQLIRADLGWKRLRPIQQQAVGPVLEARDDLLIIAGTASGKTEAAWLPAFSLLRTEADAGRGGLGVLCLSPLKALINDQVKRLEEYGKRLDLRVAGWHGDIPHARKLKLFDTPPSSIIITPESVQGLVLRRNAELAKLVVGLRLVIIDEIHAFAGTDRGMQVIALLDHVERLAGRRIPRVGLSATVSSVELMAAYLRPPHGQPDGGQPDGGGRRAVRLVRADHEPTRLDVAVHGFDTQPPVLTARKVKELVELGEPVALQETVGGHRLQMARAIDQETRGRRALAFAGSRAAVEELAALLRKEDVTDTRRSERFYAHHGSLSPELRKAAETAMSSVPDAVTVCTSTLELGVDLPDLDRVVQVDACLSIAGLRQRLGRSGRREGTRPTLRVYASEEPHPQSTVAQLRPGLVHNVAAIELIVADDWVEPVDAQPLMLSTLAHQVLANVADVSGISARGLYRNLCTRGPWRRVSPQSFAILLRALAGHGLARQDERGRLLLDEAGQRLVTRRDFYAVFQTPIEYSVRHKNKELGTLPTSYPLQIGSTLVLGGRTWQVSAIRAGGWVVDVAPHDAGSPPIFKGGFGQVHRRVRERMRDLYLDDAVPDYLDDVARGQLAQGRRAFAELGLATDPFVTLAGVAAGRGTGSEDGSDDNDCDDTSENGSDENGSLLVVWTGDRELVTLMRWIHHLRPGWDARAVSVGVEVDADRHELAAVVEQMLQGAAPSALQLTQGLIVPRTAKFDEYLPRELLAADYASRFLDVPSARESLLAAVPNAGPAARSDHQPPFVPTHS